MIKILIVVLVSTVICVESDENPVHHNNRLLAAVTRPQRCAMANQLCCQNRSPVTLTEFRCAQLSIQDCTSTKYDRICVWECDVSRLKTARFGRFAGFDDGFGKNDEFDFDKGQQKDDQITPDPGAQTEEDIIERYSYREWSPCGDQYDYKLPRADAVRILNERYPRVAIGSEKDDNTYAYPDMTKKQSTDADPKGGRRRNLLTVFPPSDDRTQSFSTGQYPRRVIGILVTDSGSWCTGTLVAPRVVLTAAHCLYDTGPNSWTGGWTFYPDTIAGTNPTPTSTGYRWSAARVTMRWVNQLKIFGAYVTWSASRDCDYGMVILKTAPGVGWMSFGYDNSLPSHFFNTYGYPGDKPFGTRWFQYCDHGQLWSQQTRSRDVDAPDCDMIGGQSGSPNYLYWPSTNRRIIYALTSGWTWTYNVYSRIDSTKFNFICDSVEDYGMKVCFP